MANQVLKGVKKYISVWQEAKDSDKNEADIVTRIIKFLEDALGYDAFEHITKEFQIKERYVDLAIKVNGKVMYYIEAKAANVTLKESHTDQAENYAAQSGVEWVVLTNGSEWQLYHLTFDKTGIEHTLVFTLDLINGDPEQNADKLFYLSYEAAKKHELSEYWEKCSSLHPSSLIKALFHEETLASIRRQIRRKKDILLSEDEVLEGIKKLLGEDVLSKYGDIIRISRKRRTTSKENGAASEQSHNEGAQAAPQDQAPQTEQSNQIQSEPKPENQ